MASPVRALLALINENVSVLEKACTASGTQIPDLNAPFHPSTEAFRGSPEAADACNVVIAAAHQLAAILTPPPAALYHVVGGHFKSAALRVCLESNVTEILREAGPQGLHVDAIAKLNGQSPRKLGQLLRVLALHHIYREVSPDVFTNTRISSMLDTLKPSKDVLADPERKHDDTLGLAALASHHLDEAFKASAYAWEVCADPQTVHSGEPTASAFAKAIGEKKTVWQYYDNPEQRFREKRFGIGMRGINALQRPDAILDAYDWKSLPPKSLVVDVGGGIGSVTHNIAKHFPDINFVVQDLPSVIDDAKQWWAKTMPDAVASGHVQLQAHDFFKPQPQKTAQVFLLKQIMHDWSDEYVLKILESLRTAATPQTILLILESIMAYTCHDPTEIPGAVGKEAPAPLLANYGPANELDYLSDIDMFLLFNSQERTIHHFETLLASTGWKITAVNRKPGDASYMQPILAIPV